MLDDALVTEPLAGFDPFGLPFRSNPDAYYPALLSHSPLMTEAGGKPAVVVAPYRQVRPLLKDYNTFSSAKPAGTPNMERVDFFYSFPVMNYCDPPHHTRLRRIVGAGFSAWRLQAIRERAGEIVEELISGLGDHPRFDGVPDLSYPFARRILLNHFIGVPPEDEHIFLDWLAACPLLDKVRPGEGKPKAFLDAWQAGTEYCEASLEKARRDNTDNLVKIIADASDGGKITFDEIMATMVVLFGGGLTAVSAVCGAACYYLARNPDVAERVRRDPELGEAFFEETLRLEVPTFSVMRFPTRDLDFEGLPVAKDTPFYVLLGAACHDPEEFPDPYRFDIDRPNNKEHMGFGSGVHTCVGNVLARAVAPLFVSHVARRRPDLRLASPETPPSYDWGNPRVRHMTSVALQA
jgi:cytochrome P450